MDTKKEHTDNYTYFTDFLTTTSLVNVCVYILGVSLTIFTLWYAYTLSINRVRYANIFLGLSLPIYYLNKLAIARQNSTNEEIAYRFGNKEKYISIFYGALAIIAILSALYIELSFDRLLLSARTSGYTTTDYIAGLTIMILVIEGTRREFGNLIGGSAVFVIIYAFLGPFLPGIFYHSGMDSQQIIRYGSVNLSGVYGFILTAGTTWVAIFIIFAGIAKTFGLLDFVIDIGREIRKKVKTGSVTMAIVTSMAMGSITGSAAANTATTGSFTIPMMKKQGIDKNVAASIESVASSGGQILPPIMGVAAFLMADILGISYSDIIQAGIIPAILFFISISLTSYFIVLKNSWYTDAKGDFNYSLLIRNIRFVFPIATLVYTLIIIRMSPLSAGFYTIIVLVLSETVSNVLLNGMGIDTLTSIVNRTLNGFKQGAIDISTLVPVLAALGIIIELLTQTGFTFRLSTSIVDLAGGNFIILLLLVMAGSILFGLGMPTPAAYLLVAILTAPTLVTFGVPKIVAHFFVFYFAVLSAITPPVAISVAVGSEIADANFLLTAKQALRIGSPGFLLPFIFIFNKSLIIWSYPKTLIVTFTSLIGMLSFTFAISGFDGLKSIRMIKRILYIVLSLGIFFLNLKLGILLSLIFCIYIGYNYLGSARGSVNLAKRMGR